MTRVNQDWSWNSINRICFILPFLNYASGLNTILYYFQEIQKGEKKFRFAFYLRVIHYVVWWLWLCNMRFILANKKFRFSRNKMWAYKNAFPIMSLHVRLIGLVLCCCTKKEKNNKIKIEASFACVCAPVDDNFHNTKPPWQSSVWRNSSSIKGQAHAKFYSISWRTLFGQQSLTLWHTSLRNIAHVLELPRYLTRPLFRTLSWPNSI